MCERTETHHEDESLPACTCQQHAEPIVTVEAVADTTPVASPKKKRPEIPHRGWHYFKRLSTGDEYEGYAQKSDVFGWRVTIPAVEHADVVGPRLLDVAGLWKTDEETSISDEWEYVKPIASVELSPIETAEAVERGKARLRPSRTSWQDDPKQVADYFSRDCDALDGDFAALADIVDRLTPKHLRAIRADVSNMLGDMLDALADCGAMSREQQERLKDELDAALDCLVEGTVSTQIVAAIVSRVGDGECATFDGFETVEAAKAYRDSDEFPGYRSDKAELVIYATASPA